MTTLKLSFIFNSRSPRTAAFAASCLLAIPQAALAKEHGTKHQRGKSDHHSEVKRIYASHPRSGFTFSFGTGYAGRGYYYGPPNSAYYYERPEVRYYATREAAPREYYRHSGYSGGSMRVAVQRELARKGFYNGSMDGIIGPQSRQAIFRYQEYHGLQLTGTITSGLLHSLGLD